MPPKSRADSPSPLPSAVKVGAVTYRVVKEANAHREGMERIDRGDCYGTTYHVDPTITLNPKNSKEVDRLVLVHELLHCIQHATLGGAMLDLLAAVDEREEYLCRMLESPLLTVLRDNPALVAFLTDD